MNNLIVVDFYQNGPFVQFQLAKADNPHVRFDATLLGIIAEDSVTDENKYELFKHEFGLSTITIKSLRTLEHHYHCVTAIFKGTNFTSVLINTGFGGFIDPEKHMLCIVDYFLSKKEDAIKTEKYRLCLDPGTKISMEITCIEDGPYSFYLRPEANPHFIKLTEQLNKTALLDIQEPLRLDSLYAANYEGIWYRVTVKEIVGNLCKVFIVDHGKSFYVNIGALKFIPMDLQNYEPFARRFCLENADKIIPKEYSQFFGDISKYQILRIIVTKYDAENKLYFCNAFINALNILDLVLYKIFQDGPKYKGIEVDSSKDYEVLISCVDSTKCPWKFCIILMDEKPKLEKLMADMAKVCEELPSKSQVHTFPGMPIVAKFNDDGQWYRAKVLEIAATVLKVNYVDYGNNDYVKYEDTRPMNINFVTSLPTQAIECRLQLVDTLETAGIQFEDKYCNDVYTMKILKLLQTGELLVELFNSSTSPPEKISLKLYRGPASVSCKSPADQLPGMLLPPISDHIKPLRNAILNKQPDWIHQDNITVNTPGLPEHRTDPKLKGEKVSKFAAVVQLSEEKTRIYERQKKQSENWDVKVDTPHQVYDHDACRPASYSRTSGMYSDRPELNASCSGPDKERWPHDKYFEQQQIFENEKTVQNNNDKLKYFSNRKWVAPSYEQDDDNILTSTPSQRKPVRNPSLAIPKVEYKFIPPRISPGLKGIEVCLTNAKSPWEFSLQHVKKAEEFRAMVKRIGVLVQPGGSALKMTHEELHPGNACLAKYKDNKWYRAQVIKLVNDHTVTVKLVDVGITCEVNINIQIKYAPVELNDLEIQNFDCTLRGAVPKNNTTWSFHEERMFQDLSNKKTLMMVDLISVDEDQRYSVVLYNDAVCVNIQFGASPESLEPRTNLSLFPMKLDSSHEVQICWFYTPLNFFVYLDYREDSTRLCKEVARIVKFCPTLLEVEKGNMVLVRFPRNPDYFRGVVVATKEDKARIFRFDTGNYQTCEKSNLRAMPESLMDIPAFAMECRLSGIQLRKDACYNEKEINNVFKSRMEFLMKVVSRDANGKLAVTLTSLNKAYNVTEELLQKSLVIKEKLPEVENSLKPGCCCKVYISHYNQLEFCVNQADCKKELESLQNQLQNLALDAAENETIPGKIAAAKNPEDNEWCRVLPLGASSKEGTKVMFIDYGNVDIPRSIKKLPEELTHIPAFSTTCQLAIKPPSNKESFESLATVAFTDFVFVNESGLVTLKTYDVSADNIIIVDILSAKKESLIDKLVELKLAQRTYTEAYMCYVESPSKFYIHEVNQELKLKIMDERLSTDNFEPLMQVDEGLLCIARYLEDGNLYRAQIISIIDESIKVLFIDYGNMSIATELKRIPIALSVIQPLAKQCTLNVLPSRESDINDFITNAMDGSILYQVKLVEREKLPWKVEVMKNGKNICDVETVKEVVYETQHLTDVYISHINSINQFWIQKVCNEQKLQDIEIGLMELQSEATELVFEGLICAAKAKSDEAWYRARIKSLTPPTVYFIDYGDSGEVTQFKELTQELIDIPALALMCSLKNVSRTNNQIINIENEMKKQCTIFQAEIIRKTTDKISVINLYKQGKNILDLFPITKHLDVKSGIEFTISNFISLDMFYIHLCTEKDKLDHLKSYICDGKKFENLSIVEDGNMCLAKYPETNTWYRALVTSFTTERTIVHLIDYGLSFDASEFKCLPEAIQKLPEMAKPCYVLNAPTSQLKVNKLEEILKDPKKPIFITDTNISKFDDKMTLGINIFKEGVNIIKLIEAGIEGGATLKKDDKLYSNDSDSECSALYSIDSDSECSASTQASVHTRSEGTVSEVELSDKESTSSSNSYIVGENEEQIDEELVNITEESGEDEMIEEIKVETECGDMKAGNYEVEVEQEVQNEEGEPGGVQDRGAKLDESKEEETLHDVIKESTLQIESGEEEREQLTNVYDEEEIEYKENVDEESEENGSIFVSDSDEFLQDEKSENLSESSIVAIVNEDTSATLETVKVLERIPQVDTETHALAAPFHRVLDAYAALEMVSHESETEKESKNLLENSTEAIVNTDIITTLEAVKVKNEAAIHAQPAISSPGCSTHEHENSAQNEELLKFKIDIEEEISNVKSQSEMLLNLESQIQLSADEFETKEESCEKIEILNRLSECLEENEFEIEAEVSVLLDDDGPVTNKDDDKISIIENESAISVKIEQNEETDTQNYETSVEMTEHYKTASSIVFENEETASAAVTETASADVTDENLLKLAKKILSEMPDLGQKIGSEDIIEIIKKIKTTPEKSTKKLYVDTKTVHDVSICKDLPLPPTPEDFTAQSSSFSDSESSTYFSPIPTFEVDAKGLMLKSSKLGSLQTENTSPDSVYGSPEGLATNIPVRPMTPRSKIPILKTPITQRPKSSLGCPVQTLSTPKSTKTKKSVLENLMATTSQLETKPRLKKNK